MLTTTQNITLSLGLDDSSISPESTSSLIDLWSELQSTSVEAVQTPTRNLFAFAETCLFFAVITENATARDKAKDGGTNAENLQMIDINEQEDLEKALNLSKLDAQAHSPLKGSPSNIPYSHTEWQHSKEEPAKPTVLQSMQESKRESKTAQSAEMTPLLSREPKTVTTPAYDDDVDDNEDDDEEGPDDLMVHLKSMSDRLRSKPFGGTPVSEFIGDGKYRLRDLGREGHSTMFSLPTHISSYVPSAPQSIEWEVDVPYKSNWRGTNPQSVTNPQSGAHGVGLIYLTSTHLENAPAGEANLGIILTPEARGKGYAKQATELVLTWVFDEIGVHRVQVGIVDSPSKDRAMTFFTQMGFVHEGVRRRAVFCDQEGINGTWKDATHLAILETEWLMRGYRKPAPKNLWDEMFARHAMEREELLKWDDKQQRLKRTASSETLRGGDITDAAYESSNTDAETEDDQLRAQLSSDKKGKKRRLNSESMSDESMSDVSSVQPASDFEDSSWEDEGSQFNSAPGFRAPFTHVPPPATPALSSARSSASHGRWSPGSVPCSGSPANSNWDLMETSSVSFSSLESLHDSEND